MKAKRIFVVVMAIVFIAASCVIIILLSISVKTNKEDGISIGVAVYKADDTFIFNMMNDFTEDVASYEQSSGSSVLFNIYDAQDSQATQNDQIDRFIALGYDVLCVNLVDRTDAADTIDMAKEADVPIIFFNREPVQKDMQKWDKLYYVGSDARVSAQLEAQIVIDIYQKKPWRIDLNGDGVIQYIMLEGESRHQDAMIRTEVSVEALKNAGLRLEKLDGGIANWDRNQASALTEQFFNEYGDDIELIICNNDDMALGAIDAVDGLGLDFINIVGIDGTPGGLAAIEDGNMLGTVVVDLDEHAQTLFNLAVALSKGQDVNKIADIQEDKSVRIPMKIVSIGS